MSLDESLLGEACTHFKEEYYGRAKCLGYNGFQVAYLKPDSENDSKATIYVLAEFHRPLFENRENRAKLKRLIPKKFDYDGHTIQVMLDYVKLPGSVLKKIREIGKLRKQD